MVERHEYTHLIVEKKYPVGYVTINRPERRNTLIQTQGGTIEQLQQAFRDMRDDPKIRVFIIRGAGDCFSAGFDQSRPAESSIYRKVDDLPEEVEWVRDVKDEPWARSSRIRGELTNPEGVSLEYRDLFKEGLWDNPKPSIALVKSFCLGAGLWLANECDVVYCTPTAVFSYPPIRYGASVVLGILPPWILGRHMTMEMGFTGKYIDAETALRCGVVNQIIDEDKIDTEVDLLALSVAKVPPVTNMMTKRAVNNYFEGLGIQQAQRYASSLVSMTENSAVPGHFFEFYGNIAELGYREALRIQREKWGEPPGADPHRDREVSRLKTEQKPKKK